MQNSSEQVLGLISTWRDRAAHLRQWAAAEGAARCWEEAARELEEQLHIDGEKTLSLAEAAAVSGYSPDHLGRLMRQGKLENAGRKHAPRVRSGDLPRKPPGACGPMVKRPSGRYDLDGLLRDIATSKRRGNDV